MNRFFKTAAMLLSMAAIAFTACEKENGDENGPADDVVKNEFKASVEISEDLVNACESIKFEYRNAEGEIVSETVDFSKLPVESVEVQGTKYNVRVWTKNITFNDASAQPYFKPTLTKKTSYTSETKPTFSYTQVVTGATKEKRMVGVDIDKIQTALDSVINLVNTFVVGK